MAKEQPKEQPKEKTPAELQAEAREKKAAEASSSKSEKGFVVRIDPSPELHIAGPCTETEAVEEYKRRSGINWTKNPIHVSEPDEFPKSE